MGAPTVDLKEALMAYVERWAPVPFCDLLCGFADHFADPDGERFQILSVVGKGAQIVWVGVSVELMQAMNDLTRERRLHVGPGSLAERVFLYDSIPSLPVVRHPRRVYKTPHWQPTFLRIHVDAKTEETEAA